MRIFTNRLGSAASANAAVDPVIPTDTPQRRLHAPTVRPPQKIAKPSTGNSFSNALNAFEPNSAHLGVSMETNQGEGGRLTAKLYSPV